MTREQDLALALIIVAFILAAIGLLEARGRSLACWAIIALTVALWLLLPALHP